MLTDSNQSIFPYKHNNIKSFAYFVDGQSKHTAWWTDRRKKNQTNRRKCDSRFQPFDIVSMLD